MVKKEFVTLPISEIRPYKNNPRNNDDAVDDVAESMAECGELDPIEIDENNEILSGHTRYKAMLKRGSKTADVIRFSGLSEETKRKYRYLTNRTGELAQWDAYRLKDELADLDFSAFSFPDMLEELFDVDEIEPVNGYDAARSDKEYFTAALTFPTSRKREINSYLRLHKREIEKQILEAASLDF